MKYVKKNLFGIGIAFAVLLGIGLSFLPQEAQASIEVPKPKCYHQGGTAGTLLNFCSGSTCVEKYEGPGTNWAKCG